MAMTPEAKVKNKAVKQLKELGAYYFFPATAGFGKSGVPDIVACYKGMFFGIECKAGNSLSCFTALFLTFASGVIAMLLSHLFVTGQPKPRPRTCLLYTSDAADE